ncbi:DUF1570 domain-containing protein [Planctellipticum variicoloris]|uniref:DUF1570 domain-containing protein n=1 Tax=Planctellipticum variicoloris TaxID=3064265 RepID=UPI003013D6AF|nr:DUF1570 domain-containing protein [Planctomycetaceae bacterium SH412]
MGTFWRVLPGLLLSCVVPSTATADDPALQISVRGREYTGRVVASNSSRVWFQGRDGRLEQFPVDWVSDYRELGASFRPASAAETKSALTREFGDRYRVAWSGPYVVAGRAGMAERYATIFDELYRDFRLYFSTRGFKLGEPEFPLAAICFATREEFLEYCREEQVRLAGPVVGVYLSASNRVALYEQPVASDIDATVIHEATHQLAFNLGVHSRIGVSPRWVVEGLAEVFENASFRRRQQGDRTRDRANLSRLRHFSVTYLPKRPDNALEELVRSDAPFRASPLDAYSEAWALSFFLAETRAARYSEYLRRIAARDPTADYSGEDRLKDFRAVFSTPTGVLDAEFRRFIDQLGR